MKNLFVVLALLTAGCGTGYETIDKSDSHSPDNSGSQSIKTSNQSEASSSDAGKDQSSSVKADSGADVSPVPWLCCGNVGSNRGVFDAGHDSAHVEHDAGHDVELDASKAPIRDADIDSWVPAKDAGVDSFVAPKDAGIDSWVAPTPPGSVATGGHCTANIDCTVGGCDYNNHCITAISCTQHHGGDTCGAGEDTELGINPTPATGEESCCTTIQIPGTNYTVDKYLVTSGRMRAMVTALNGNLRAFTKSIHASNPYWNPAWNAYIPSTIDEVDEQLGPYPAPLTPDPYNPNDHTADDTDHDFSGNALGQWRDGCTMGSPDHPDGARTWWTNKMMGGDLAPIVYPQDFLDDKMLNCVDSYLLTAFCIWDGGHLATLDELAAAWGPGKFPWSAVAPNVSINLKGPNSKDADHATYQMPLGTDANGLDMSSYVAHEFGALDDEFSTPFTYNYDPYNLDADNTYHIAAPGRLPLGAGPYGHMDMVGESYPATMIQPGLNPSSITEVANVEHIGTTSGTGSWEIHPIEPGSGTEQEDPLFRPAWWAYYAMGGRCAR